MARSPGAASATKKDWRARPPQDGGTTGWRHFRRFFFSLLLAGLAVWLVLLIIPGCGPKCQLVCLPIRDYEVTIAPVPYATRNVEELKARLAEANIPCDIWDDFQTSKSLTSLTNRLQPLSKPGTALILYLCAHGVSDNGKAFLLCGDFQPYTNRDGRIELGNLLAQIRACPARLKLVILDLAGLAADPRLGFVVNEFPRLAETEVRKTADPDLYVLLSHSPHEQPQMAHAARRSIFNYYVTEGLRGAANQEEANDYVVDLAELYAYVRAGVGARAAQQTDDRLTQTPLLLRGGQGVCQEAPKGLALVKVAPELPKEAAGDIPKTETENKKLKAETEGNERNDEAARPAEKPSKTTSGNSRPTAESNAQPAAKSSEPNATSDLTAKSQSSGSNDARAAKTTRTGAQGGAPVADLPEPSVASPKALAEAAKDSPSKLQASPAAKASSTTDAENKLATKTRSEKASDQTTGKPEAGSLLQSAAKLEAKQPLTGEPSAESSAAPSTPSAAARPGTVAALLHQAWQRRDREQRRQGDQSWSPIDYAPHLWREYNEILLGFELRYRWGVEFRKERLDALGELAAGREGASGFAEATIFGRLRRAQHDFLADSERLERFKQARRDGLGDIEDAIKLRNDLMFVVPYYVRWHGQLAFAASIPSPLHVRIMALLDDEHLPKLVKLLELLERLPPGENAEQQRALAELRTVKRRVEELRGELEDGAFGPYRMAEEMLKGPPKRVADLRTIESLLSVPLLPAEIRSRLIQRLAELDLPLDSALAWRSRSPSGPPPSQRAWDRAADQLRLEMALARLADHDFKPAHTPISAFTPHLAKSDDLWEEYRTLGRELGDFYQTMADRIFQLSDSRQSADVQAAARLLRLIDGRDVSALRIERADRIALVPPPPSSELRLQLSVPEQVILARDQAWTPVDIELKLSGPCGDYAGLTVEYDARRIEVVDRNAKPLTRIRSGEQQTRRLDRKMTDQVVSWRLNVRPQGDLNWTDLRFTVRATAEKARGLGEIRVILPPPDIVDLTVERVLDLVSGAKVPADRISGLQGAGREGQSDLLCDVYPNRITEFVVSLRNRSGKPKKVTVELYAPPPSLGDATEPLAGPLDRWGKPLPGYRLIASATDVELGPDETPVPIPFGKTKVEEKNEEKKEIAEKAAKPAEKADGKEKGFRDQPLVSRGLACVIYDLSAKDAQATSRVRWLRFQPVAPRQYIQPSVRCEEGRLSIQIRPLERPSLPRLSEETPITIDWDVQGTIDPNARMSTHAEIRAPDQSRELFAYVPPKTGREIPVQLAVDGYPRAFVFRVPTDRPLRIEELRDLRDVRIVAPRPGQAYRIPLVASIFTEFQVDAPADAFRNWSADKARDVIELTIEVPSDRAFVVQDPLRFYGDRQFEARVAAIESAGLLKIDARVHDFKVPLYPGDLKNAEVAVRVAMSLSSTGETIAGGRDVKTASVRVIFDAAKPIVRLIEAPRAPVTQGNNVAVTIEVDDPQPGSGVAKVEYGLREGDLTDFAEQDNPAEVLPPNIQSQMKLPPLTTKDLKPGKYALVVRATDRVGWRTAGVLTTVEIVEPPPPPKPMEKDKPATMSSISGRAILGSPDVRIQWIGLKVTLKELNRTVAAGEDGRFDFPNVPPGVYTLEATGIGGNKRLQGSTRVTVTEQPASVDLPMQ